MFNLAMIITAAGRSTRFPPNKLLEILEDRTAIEHTVNTFITFELDIYVILGYQSELVHEVLFKRFEDKIIYEFNTDFHSGLSSSVITGVKAAGNIYDYWCFCPGDKPFIQARTVAMLIEKLNEKKPLILAPRYDNKPGHPTFFSTELAPFFLATTGDTGGRQVIETFRSDTLFVDVPDEGVSLDMDYYMEFENARK
ncbi:MAG: nucleotidyltransferase family protein [Candidatus Marinimicrobia bacterium]|nr:nucleotidyltransferase family protein [Candidatus Neomarinimicrobiota bacterium]MCF7922757.1 nucleotidyltransferase family protein [Candidatus Neomarinimicrobiota bacterium]